MWQAASRHHQRSLHVDPEARGPVVDRADIQLGGFGHRRRVDLRWLGTVVLPDLGVSDITHQQLLRSMDAIMDHQQAVDGVLAGLLRPMVDQDLSVVFYDLTTIRTEGLSTLEGDVRQFGMAKEGLIARQFMLGVVQTAEGLPIYHEVFDGNAAETKTLLPTLKKVLQRFPAVRRLVLVADRGLLSLDNLQALQAVRLGRDQALEFINAVLGRRYHEFADLLGEFQQQCVQASEEITGEVPWNGLRLVVTHDPATAAATAAGPQGQGGRTGAAGQRLGWQARRAGPWHC